MIFLEMVKNRQIKYRCSDEYDFTQEIEQYPCDLDKFLALEVALKTLMADFPRICGKTRATESIK